MMSILSEKLQSAFKKIRGYGTLTESNIADSMREIRLALLSADVNYQVARDFCERVKTRALGKDVQGSIRPGDLFVKIVHDELVALFRDGDREVAAERPLRILLCGLNGAGKTTTAGKLAGYFKKQGEKVLLVAADLARPAAVQQLVTLGEKTGVPVHVPAPGAGLAAHLRTAREESVRQGATVVIFDTAGRLELDEALLAELTEAARLIEPQETLLVADAATGQSAVEVAKAFQGAAPLTGLVLSKFDGDAKGGAALSLHSATGCPVKFLGTGEQLTALEAFEPERLVGRMLGMGDIVGLVEKAQQEIDWQDAEKMAAKFRSNSFNLQDFLDQMKMIRKMGPLQNLLGMMPGFHNIPSSAFDERAIRQTEAIICSMTKEERLNPDLLNARRRQRIAAGSGTAVMQVNDLMRRFLAMKKMMAKMSRGGNQEKKLKGLQGRFAP
jgi:signal recognition particle subunit SRP54